MTFATDIVRPRRLRRAATVAGSALAGALVWAVARVGGVDLTVDMNNGEPPMQIGLPIVVLFALLAALAGWLLLVILERYTARPRTLWTSAAIGILALSFVPLLGVEAAADAKVYLALMHIAVAAVLVAGFRPGVKE